MTTSFDDCIWRQTWRIFFVRSCPQRKLDLTKKFPWNRLGSEMVASLVIQWELENSDSGGYFCFFSESSCCWYSDTVFLFLFILVHSIIENGEKGLHNVYMFDLKAAPLGEETYKLVTKATPDSHCDAHTLGLFSGSLASRPRDSDTVPSQLEPFLTRPHPWEPKHEVSVLHTGTCFGQV